MRTTFGKLFVEPVDSDASALKFAFKVQDPKGPDHLMRELQSAVQPGDPPLTEDRVEILGLELAIDGFRRDRDSHALAPAVLHLFVHHALPPVGAPRITRPRHFHVPSTKREILHYLVDGYTLHGGPKNACHSSHFYVKTHDSIDGQKYTLLPQKQWRARFENTWMNEATPFKTIAQWRNFKFESLSTKFALVIPTTAEGLALLMQDRKIQLGTAPDAPKIRPSDRRRRAPYTRRDTITNDKFRQALRALTRHQSCENSVKNSPEISRSPEGEHKLEAGSPKYLNTYTSSAHIDHQSLLIYPSNGQSSTTQDKPILDTPRQDKKQSNNHVIRAPPPR